MTVQIYRLRRSVGNYTASSGDVKLYQNFEQFKLDLLQALIEEASQPTREERDRHRGPRWWNEHVLRRGREVGTGEWQTKRVIAAEKLVDGEWVDLGARLIEPAVVFEGEQ